MWQVSSRHDLVDGQVGGRGRRRCRAPYYGIYLSGLDDRLLPTWYGHTGLELLFLASGVLFTLPLLSSDPLPAKQGYGGRLLDVAIEMPLHAFFGVVLMMATTPIVEFFATPPASWDLDPMADQKVAGGLAWAYGELPTVLILVFIAHQWFRADTRQARRADAEADLHGTPELDAYNAYLEQLASSPVPHCRIRPSAQQSWSHR